MRIEHTDPCRRTQTFGHDHDTNAVGRILAGWKSYGIETTDLMANFSEHLGWSLLSQRLNMSPGSGQLMRVCAQRCLDVRHCQVQDARKNSLHRQQHPRRMRDS